MEVLCVPSSVTFFLIFFLIPEVLLLEFHFLIAGIKQTQAF